MSETPPKIPPAVVEVAESLTRAGHQAFLVGGCVRDLLRHQPPKDFDLATSALPEQVQAVFPKVIPTGIAHGTVTVIHRGQHVEVTTFRSESDYVDGRRPGKVEFHGDIRVDLGRRDFTINAMAMGAAGGEVIDPWGGQADLAAKRVRCVRSARERFNEDGLRALRAVRFATVLDFEIEPETFAAIAPTVPVFKKVAIERVREEFQKILLSPGADRGLTLLHASGLADAFLPAEVRPPFAAVGSCPPVLEVRLTVLLSHLAKPAAVVTQLKFPTRTITDVGHLAAHRALPLVTATDAELRRYLARLGLDALDGVLAVARALGSGDDAVAARLREVAATKPALSAKELALDGREIMAALGVGPSPAVGIATRRLVEAVLDDPTQNTPEKLRQLLSSGAP